MPTPETIDEEKFIETAEESIRNGAEYIMFLAKKLIAEPLKSPGAILEIRRVAKELKRTKESYLTHFPKEDFKPHAKDEYEIIYEELGIGTHYVVVPVVERGQEKGEEKKRGQLFWVIGSGTKRKGRFLTKQRISLIFLNNR